MNPLKGILRTAILFLVLISQPGKSLSQQHDSKLEKKLAAALEGFRGEAGIYVKNLKTGKVAAIDADSLFPTASMIKLPILTTVCWQIDRGNLDYHQQLMYRDSLLYAGEDILGSFMDSQQISLAKVMMLMMTMSDNTASLWLQHLCGDGVTINHLMDSLGFTATRMNSRTPGRRGNWEQYGWGQTSPRELATLLEKVYKHEILSAEACERMLRHLKRNFWDAEAISQIPPSVNTFSKNGAVDAARSEVILVNAPHGDFVFCITTKNQADTSWAYGNEGWELVREVTRIIWKHFEPKSNWKPMPAGKAEKWF